MEGPARITSRAETAKMFKEGGDGGGVQAAPPTNLRIINAFDSAIVGDFMGSDDGEEIIMNVIQRNSTTIKSMGV